MASRLPFTESQWEELQHQALIYKYIVAGIPVPPDLLFPIKRTLFFSPSSSSPPYSASKLFARTAPPHFAWNVYDMGLGRKIDPEPGRCRRTDGKKWRCSKEAYPDSKYCERHMHRGKNRSRKPVEFSFSSSTTNANISSNSSSSSSSSPLSSSANNRSRALSVTNNLRGTSCDLSPFCLNSNPSVWRSVNGLALTSHQDHDSARPFLQSPGGSSFSFAADNNLSNGRERRSAYMDDFFSVEPSGTIRSFTGSTMEDCSSWNYTPLTTLKNTTSPYSPKQRVINNEKLPDRRCFILGADVATTTRESPLMMFGKELKQSKDEDEEEERNKRVHRFLDEWPSSNGPSVSTSLFI